MCAPFSRLEQQQSPQLRACSEPKNHHRNAWTDRRSSVPNLVVDRLDRPRAESTNLQLGYRTLSGIRMRYQRGCCLRRPFWYWHAGLARSLCSLISSQQRIGTSCYRSSKAPRSEFFVLISPSPPHSLETHYRARSYFKYNWSVSVCYKVLRRQALSTLCWVHSLH